MRLFEILTGLEVYEIPEHHGHTILSVVLEPIENIISEFDVPAKKKDSKIFFNTKTYARSIIDGFIPSIQALFVKDEYILHSSAEFEALRASRSALVGDVFIDRCLSEFEDVYAMSNEPFQSQIAFDRAAWEDRISKKIYCIYQLDSCLKIMDNKDLPGEPLDFTKFPDIPTMNTEIKNLLEKIKKSRKEIYLPIDYNFIIRTLRVQYLHNIDKYING